VTAALVTLLSACGSQPQLSEEDRVAVQETQLAEFIQRADGWGAEIVANVPASEVETLYPNMGGSRGAGENYEQWPRYYYWFQGIDLLAEGARSPSAVADDLEPWLKRQGWERNTDVEFPPGQERFERDYFREGYHLIVEVYTEEPPMAQAINFKIVTPQTDPSRD